MIVAKLLAAAAIAMLPVAASAGLADGSFEIKGGALPVTDYCYDGFATPGGPACASGAWFGNGVIRSGSGPWGGTMTPAGDYFGFVQGLGVLSQSFTADTTGSFTLGWLDAGRTNNGGPQSYTVTITEDFISARGFMPSAPGDIQTLGTYTTNATPFTLQGSSAFALVAGTSYTLSFTGLSTEDRTSFIDAVVLSAVPEPATWGLMLVGFAAVGLAARRRGRALTA